MNDALTQIYRYFQEISLSTSIDETVQRTSLFLERPVALIDAAMNHVSHYPDGPCGDGDWDSLIASGRVRLDYVDVTRRNNTLPPVPGMLYRCTYSPPNATEMGKYRCMLQSGSTPLGGMMVLEGDRPFESGEITAMQLAAQTLSQSLMKHYGPLYIQQAARQHILCDLLTEDAHNVLSRMAKEHPELYALEGEPMVVGCAIPQPGDYDLAPFWQHTIVPSLPHGQVIQYQGNLLFFLPLGAVNYETFVSSLRMHLQSVQLQISLSSLFTSFLDMKAHYELARQALLIGLEQDPGEHLYSVGDYRLPLMLRRSRQSNEAFTLCHPAALRLAQHDTQNGTHFCSILRAYLFHFHNYSLAAKALFMHRNTLTYHLERIERLLDIDLDDPKTCLEMLLSLMVMGK